MGGGRGDVGARENIESREKKEKKRRKKQSTCRCIKGKRLNRRMRIGVRK
jgi:hypothetical protein